MLGKTKWLLATSLVLSMAMVVPVQAQSKKSPAAKAPTNQQLLERIEALESELSKQKESSKSTRAKVVDLEQRANDIQVDFKDSRPTFKTGDGRFTLSLRARFQADYVHHLQSKGIPSGNNGDLGSGANIRRAYFGIEGKAFNDFWYELRLDAGSSDAAGPVYLNRARVAYHGIPNFRINVGIIQPMMNYQDSVSSGELTFIERPTISNLLVDNFGGAGNRKGVELTFQRESFFYGGDNIILTGAYTGARTNTTASDTAAANFTGHQNGGDEESNVVARLAYRVYSDQNTNIQVGANFARALDRSAEAGDNAVFRLRDRPEIRVSGTRLIDTGTIATTLNSNSATAFGYDAQVQWRNFYLAGEYNKYEFDIKNANALGNPNFDGWYVEGSWILTGQSKVYNKNSMSNNHGSFSGPKVVTPFSLKGHSWGVWEVAARYSSTDLNWNEHRTGGIAGGEQNIITLGVNWYLNNNVKLQVNNLIVNVQRPAGAGASSFNNTLGQNANIIAGRLQFQL